MRKTDTVNTFDKGMNLDSHPLSVANDTLTGCLNGTLITYNGNEHMLLNDMGNGRVETAYLPEGYVPLGTCSFGGIIYIVSYNPLIDKCLIGCFPSPERNITSDEIQTPEITVKDSLFRNDRKVTNTVVKVKLLSDPNSKDGIFKLNPGDKYTIFSTNEGITANATTISDVRDRKRKKMFGGHKVDTYPKYVTIHVVSIGEDGKITYLDDSLKWTDDIDYYIKELEYKEDKEKYLIDLDSYRDLVSTAYNVFNSRVSGELALMFELKVIDSFTVTWDATVTERTPPKPDAESPQFPNRLAEITFNLNWTSGHSSINPSQFVLTESIKSEELKNVNEDNGSVDKDSICKIPYTDTDNANNLNDITEYRKNDGTDESFKAKVGTFLYNSSNNLSDYVWHYEVTPAMPFGELDYLAVEGVINFADIGSGKININEWRYFISPDSITLHWNLEAYPEKNKSIERVIMTFIPFDKITRDAIITDIETAYLEDTYPLYLKISNESFSGGHQEIFYFENSSEISGEGLEKNYLYLVDVCIKYGNGTEGWKYIHNYKWLYTTGLWNNQFGDEKYRDFSEEEYFTLDNVLEFKGSFESEDFIKSKQTTTELTLPDTTPDNLEYAAMGAKIITVNYDDTTNSFNKENNVSLKLNVSPNYDELFTVKVLENDLFTNEIGSKTITTDGIEIDYDSYNVLTDKVQPKIMTGDINENDVKTAINSITAANKIKDEETDNKAIDSFGVEFSDNNSKTSSEINLNVYGAIFSRINAELRNKTISIELRIRPFLRDYDDLERFGLEKADLISMRKYFTEGHRNEGAGDPFAWHLTTRNWDGTTISEYDSWPSGGGAFVEYNSLNDKWDPHDDGVFDHYWDVPPYNNYLNDEMNLVGSPIVIMRYNEPLYKGKGGVWIYPRREDRIWVGKGVANPLFFGLWCKTDANHFVPVFTLSNNKQRLADLIALFLMQVYYVDDSPQPIERSVVENINYVKPFTETWNIGISSLLNVTESSETIHLKVNKTDTISLAALLEEVRDKGISTRNIEYNGEREINAGSTIFSHSFRVDTREMYSQYEDAKSTVINTIVDLITSPDPIISKESRNPNLLYVWDNSGRVGKFLTLNESNGQYIDKKGSIKHIGDRLVLEDFSGGEWLSIAPAAKIVDGELVFDEDILLHNSITYSYDTTDSAYCEFKSNSPLGFTKTHRLE